METGEFVVQSRLDAQVLEAWVEAGWLLPRQDQMHQNQMRETRGR